MINNKVFDQLQEALAERHIRLSLTSKVGELFGNPLYHYSIVRTKPGVTARLYSVIIQDMGADGYSLFGECTGVMIAHDVDAIAGPEPEPIDPEDEKFKEFYASVRNLMPKHMSDTFVNVIEGYRTEGMDYDEVMHRVSAL